MSRLAVVLLRPAIPILILAITTQANAQLVTISLRGTVSRAYDYGGVLGDAIDVGDSMYGTYTYDTSVLGTYLGEDGMLYQYSQGTSGIILQIGDFTFQSDPTNLQFNVTVTDERLTYAGNTFDRLSLVSAGNVPLQNELSVPEISLLFYAWDFEGDPLSDITLPLEAIDLGECGKATFDIDVQGFLVGGQLTYAVLVPEPATFALFGMVGLILVRNTRSHRI